MVKNPGLLQILCDSMPSTQRHEFDCARVRCYCRGKGSVSTTNLYPTSACQQCCRIFISDTQDLYGRSIIVDPWPYRNSREPTLLYLGSSG